MPGLLSSSRYRKTEISWQDLPRRSSRIAFARTRLNTVILLPLTAHASLKFDQAVCWKEAEERIHAITGNRFQPAVFKTSKFGSEGLGVYTTSTPNPKSRAVIDAERWADTLSRNFVHIPMPARWSHA